MMKLKLREARGLQKDHAARKWQGLIQIQFCLAPKPRVHVPVHWPPPMSYMLVMHLYPHHNPVGQGLAA